MQVSCSLPTALLIVMMGIDKQSPQEETFRETGGIQRPA